MEEGNQRIAALLADAERARRGRDLWRNVRPILMELHAAGVSYRAIGRATGISAATVGRIVGPSSTGASSTSTATP